jgi:tricorn protease
MLNGINRLWIISVNGGPAGLVLNQWAYNGAYSPDGKQMVIDLMSRLDVEWRNYRGGQNTPLVVIDLANLTETIIKSDSTIDLEPVSAVAGKSITTIEGLSETGDHPLQKAAG